MTDELKIGIIIPAREASTRLPGKPLIDLLGKSMIQRTWERCAQAIDPQAVYVATDSEKIFRHIESFGGQAVMTSQDCLTGTDRIAEANRKLGFDIVVNVQGDEPIVDPQDILQMIEVAKQHPQDVVNAYAPIHDAAEFESRTVPKVVVSQQGTLLYMSRSAIPGTKEGDFISAHKQICIYAFPQAALASFASASQKSPLEAIEDIEILRFLETGYTVKMIEVSGNSMAVDVQDDVEKVIQIISQMSETEQASR